MTTAAAIDRLVHHAIILEMTGSSFRTEQAKERQQPAPRTDSDTSTEDETQNPHRSPEPVTEAGGPTDDVKK